jgi:hypothetical protein
VLWLNMVNHQESGEPAAAPTGYLCIFITVKI